MSCQASGYPEPEISWSEVFSGRSITASLSEVQEGWQILENATISDSKTFACIAKNEFSRVKASASVTVIPKLKFVIRPVEWINTTIGSRVLLRCQASTSAISWSREGTVMPNDYEVLQDGTLVINMRSFEQEGSYICTARSVAAEINASAKVSIVMRSCSEWRLAGYNASGDYKIKPGKDMSSFQVFCNMTDKGGVGVSVISHNSEEKTMVKGYMYRGSYSKDVEYNGLTMNQIINLIQASSHCEQFIKYECHHSVLLWHDSPYGWWVSRDGKKMMHWGGATPGSNKCACGMNDTCATGGKCNCDANDLTWREDSGLLTDKSTLPVIQLRFGDTGDPRVEKGFHTLGKLKCYGIAYMDREQWNSLKITLFGDDKGGEKVV